MNKTEIIVISSIVFCSTLLVFYISVVYIPKLDVWKNTIPQEDINFNCNKYQTQGQCLIDRINKLESRVTELENK